MYKQVPDKRLFALCIAVAEPAAVAVFVILFHYQLIDWSRVASGGDLASLFWPMKEFRLRSIGEYGVIPLWNHYTFMGAPFAASMQHALYYPFDYLFAWLSPIPGAVNPGILLHIIWAGIGTWWFVRKGWRIGAAASIAAGVAFTGSAWFWTSLEHPNRVAIVSWMPWLLGTVLFYAHKKISVPKFIALYSAMGGMQLLVGHPQAIFYTHATAGIMVIGFALSRSENRMSEFKRLALPFVAAVLLAGLIGGVNLLPGLELSKYSYRQFATEDASHSLDYSMPPKYFAALLAPNQFGTYTHPAKGGMVAGSEYNMYVGWAVLMFGFAGTLWLARQRRWRALLFLCGLIGLTYLLAIGGNASFPRILNADFSEHPPPAQAWWQLSLHEIYVWLIPPARGFRVPARVLIVTALMWSVLCAFGVQSLIELSWRVMRRMRMNPRIGYAAVTMVAISLIWLSLYLPSRGWKFRFPENTDALVLAMNEDMERMNESPQEGRLYRLTVSDAELLFAERNRDSKVTAENTLGESLLTARWLRYFENNNVVVGLQSVEGYEEGLLPTVRTKDFLFSFNRHLRDYHPDEQLLGLLGVSRIFSDLPLDENTFRAIPQESRKLRPIYSVPSYKGIAFWKIQTEGVDLTRLEGPFWMGGEPLGMRAQSRHNIGRMQRWEESFAPLTANFPSPNTVQLTAQGQPPGDSLLAMGYAPGWRLNGNDVEWINAIHAVIPAEELEDGKAFLRYEPHSYRLGGFLSTTGIFISLLLFTQRKRNRLRLAA